MQMLRFKELEPIIAAMTHRTQAEVYKQAGKGEVMIPHEDTRRTL